MEPALRQGDRLLVDGAAFRRRPPVEGDLVVLIDPAAPRRRLIKRVAAVGPGWFVVGRRGVGRIPGAHPRPPDPEALEEFELAPTQLLVISDALDRGRDSRHFGPVEATAVLGRAWWRYGPRARRGPL